MVLLGGGSVRSLQFLLRRVLTDAEERVQRLTPLWEVEKWEVVSGVREKKT